MTIPSTKALAGMFFLASITAGLPTLIGIEWLHIPWRIAIVVLATALPSKAVANYRHDHRSPNMTAAILVCTGYLLFLGYFGYAGFGSQDEFDNSIGTWALAPVGLVALLVGALISREPLPGTLSPAQARPSK